jgi:hypothetical protein
MKRGPLFLLGLLLFLVLAGGAYTVRARRGVRPGGASQADDAQTVRVRRCPEGRTVNRHRGFSEADGPPYAPAPGTTGIVRVRGDADGPARALCDDWHRAARGDADGLCARASGRWRCSSASVLLVTARALPPPLMQVLFRARIADDSVATGSRRPRMSKW